MNEATSMQCAWDIMAALGRPVVPLVEYSTAAVVSAS